MIYGPWVTHWEDGVHMSFTCRQMNELLCFSSQPKTGSRSSHIWLHSHSSGPYFSSMRSWLMLYLQAYNLVVLSEEHDSWNLLPNLIGLQHQSVSSWPSGVLETNRTSMMLLCRSPKGHSSWEETKNGLRIQTSERTPGCLQWGASMNELIKMYSLLLGAAAQRCLALEWCWGVRTARQEGDAGGGREAYCVYPTRQRTKRSLRESCWLQSPGWLLWASVIIKFHIFYWY